MSTTARHIPLLVVAVVVMAGFAIIATGAVTSTQETASEPVTVTNSTNYLSPASGDVPEEEYNTVGVDVGSAVAMDRQRLRGEHDMLRFDQRYQDPENTAEDRRNLIHQASTAVDTRTTSIEREQERLIRGYSDGTISSTELLSALINHEAAAERQRRLVTHIRTTTNVPVDLEREFSDYESRLVWLPGAVSDDFETAVSGAGEPLTIYLQAAEDDLVLSTMREGQHHREATLRSQRDPNGIDQFRQTGENPAFAAFQRASQLYPWVFNNTIGTPSTEGFGEPSVYHLEVQHEHGALSVYLDGSTQNVFRENQYQQPERIPVTTTATNATQELQLTVESTQATGPMRVSANSTSGPLSADTVVTVDGYRVGTVGSDGVLWTVQPSGEFTVRLTSPDEETVSVTAS